MREIKVSYRDLIMKVDNQDFDLLSKYYWSHNGNCVLCYVKQPDKTRKRITPAQVIFNTDKIYDHKDRDELNNTRDNLREANKFQNAQNKSPVGGTSIYKGVSWYFNKKLWRARITKEGKRIHLGYFTTEIAAAKAYDSHAKILHGEFAYLNFRE